ncbi:ligand-gated channel [Leisingera sp. ANG-M1]|uniref:TonB-dependent receptor domain-containing protein n=1 Tax=Leisingera sp. ANG-M1 TaxID=1577895 RepID=UPI00057FAA3B|nr:TonB-dependent receptor [Leisingera sp. ANG-M1]KIC08743.1 ligand-gated channel [Leisingera sp. ANG-M1]
MGTYHKGWRLLSTVSVLGLMASAGSLTAQEIIEDEDFLGTVELGAGKREVQTSTAKAVTVISQEEIDDRQASTIAELIDSVPGVTLVNGSTPQGSGINIRGFGANSTFGTDNKVLIAIDGATTGAEEIYRIGNQLFTDPALFREVRVSRGINGSFEFASGVVGGIVELETKDASDFTGGEIGLRVRQSLEASSNAQGWNSSTTLAWMPTEDLEFLAHYTVRDNDDYKDGDGTVAPNSAFRTPSWLVKGKYTFGDAREHSIAATFTDTTSNDQDVPYDTFTTTSGSFGNVDREVRTKVAQLNYNYNPVGNDLVDLDVILSYSEQTIEQAYRTGSSSCDVGGLLLIAPGCFFGPPPAPGTAYDSSTQDADHYYEITKLTVKNSMFLQTGAASHDLRFGVEYLHRERPFEAAAAPAGTDKRFALFVSDDISIGDAWTISPELRYEMQDISGTPELSSPSASNAGDGEYDNSALMGGLSVRYEFQSGFALFGSAGYTESLPIIDDLENPAFMTRPELATGFEAGASYSGADVLASGDTVQAKINVYDTTLRDVTTSGRGTIDRIEIQGVELEAGYGLANGFYADLNANWSTGSQTTTSGAETGWAGIPANSARLTLGKRFGETVDLSWELAASVDSINPQNEAVAGYGIHNLRATYKPQTGALEGTEIRFGIENAFDKTYRTSLATRNAPGRNFKVSIAKTF